MLKGLNRNVCEELDPLECEAYRLHAWAGLSWFYTEIECCLFFFWLSDQLCFQLDADRCSCPFSLGCHQRCVCTFGSASSLRCDPGGCSEIWVPPEALGGPWAPHASYPAYDEVSLVSFGVGSCGSTTGIYFPVEKGLSCSRRHLCVHNSYVEEDMSL